MTIRIEIDDETAAAIWDNHFRQPDFDLAKAVTEIVTKDVGHWKKNYAKMLPGVLADFKARESRCTVDH